MIFKKKNPVKEPLSNERFRRIAVLGGSFNPPHIGHVAICRYILNGGRADEIWVVPCSEHPFGKPLVSFNDRITMCRFAFQEFKEKVRILDVEKKLGGVSYTVRTLKYLTEKHPTFLFHLIMGGDVQGETSEWQSMDEVRKLAKILTVPRGPGSFIPDVSSTNIRENIKCGRPYAEMVPSEVAIYIVTHGLYHE